MYLSHFQLNLKPFQLNSDKRFLYLSEKHEEALAILRYGILDNRGVLVLTGDVGTGKTLLIHALVETLGPNVQTALITDPSLKGLDFFKFMAHAFGMGSESKTKGEFLINFENFLDSLSKANQQALLIIDEAQCIDPIQLEEIRILSNLERGNNRLNIFFVGQDEFDLVLADKQLRALKQRITTHYHLAPLTIEETGLYVRYRLKVAGCDRPLFTPSALEKIFGLTNGYPRLINIICDHCLLSAFVKRVHQIDPSIVEESAADLMYPSQLNEETHSPVENKPELAITPQADIQPAAAPRTPPGVTTQTTKQVDLPEPHKPFISLLQTFLRKPAYLLAVAVLLPALVWFNFRDDPYFRRQASWLFPTLHQENQTRADIEPIQSSTLNKDPGAPQMDPGQRLGPTDLATKNPTDQQSINTAAAPPDQSAPPVVVPPTVRSEDIAAPPMDSSPDAPTVIQPLVVEDPIDTDPATPEKGTNENLDPPSPILEPDQIATPNEKAEAAEIVLYVSPLSTVPVASETDAPPLLSAKKGGTELAAAQETTTPLATASTPVEATSELKPDQATQSDLVDAPSPSASPIEASTAVVDEQPQALSVTPLPATTLAEPPAGEPAFRDTESDPRAIIDFVIRKRSRQSGGQ